MPIASSCLARGLRDVLRQIGRNAVRRLDQNDVDVALAFGIITIINYKLYQGTDGTQGVVSERNRSALLPGQEKERSAPGLCPAPLA